MKYFTYELVAAANDWIDQTQKQCKQAEKRFWRVADEYNRELERLKPRLSKPAWDFFRHGFAETGLHDARLLSFSIGDGLNYEPDGTTPFRVNYQRTQARIEFLNYYQQYHYTFALRGIKRARMDLIVEEDSYIKSIGDLFIYELTGIDNEHLQLSFLFSTGAEIELEFKRLTFKRRNLHRQYDPGDMYS